MNESFFEEYKIPRPKFSLGVGSGSHAEQTAKMMTALEPIFISEKPDLVQVYGDTNSTVAAALVAAKLHIPISHIEAGMRSFNRKMPEEINRVVTDHLSSLLFVPTKSAQGLLKKEGITKNVHWIGDVMLDVVMLWNKLNTNKKAPISGDYVFATIHRAENTDSKERLSSIIEGLRASGVQVYLPVHPRLQKLLDQHDLKLPSNVCAVSPLTHAQTLSAISFSRAVVTDSGGLQKEAFYLGKPCITVRDETEWTELVTNKVNILTGTNSKKITSEIKKALNRKKISCPKLYKAYGAGQAAQRAVKIIEKYIRKH